jgi:hypothetical protein
LTQVIGAILALFDEEKMNFGGERRLAAVSSAMMGEPASPPSYAPGPAKPSM